MESRDRAATKKFGGYRLLYPPPAPLGLGLHSAENLQSARHFHENGSDRDDVEGGRELGWFHGRRRPFLTWGLHGQVHHRGGLWCVLRVLFAQDRDFLHMAGVRTIILDGLPGDGDGIMMSALRSLACGMTGGHILGCLG